MANVVINNFDVQRLYTQAFPSDCLEPGWLTPKGIFRKAGECEARDARAVFYAYLLI